MSRWNGRFYSWFAFGCKKKIKPVHANVQIGFDQDGISKRWGKPICIPRSISDIKTRMLHNKHINFTFQWNVKRGQTVVTTGEPLFSDFCCLWHKTCVFAFLFLETWWQCMHLFQTISRFELMGLGSMPPFVLYRLMMWNTFIAPAVCSSVFCCTVCRLLHSLSCSLTQFFLHYHYLYITSSNFLQ